MPSIYDPVFQQAAFMTSAARLEQCPEDAGREVAFAGRSNCGKSSALNTLTMQKQLARTSKTPGRTQLINFFGLAGDARLVDLPGYGYAQVPMSVKEHWQQHLEKYLQQRRSLTELVLLMDARHPLKPFDTHMLEWARLGALPVLVLLTKCDKLTRGAAAKTLLEVKKAIADEERVQVQLFSSLNRAGVDAARDHLGLRLWPEGLPEKMSPTEYERDADND